MALRLVSTGDGPALALRDHLVPIIRRDGSVERQRDAVRIIGLRTGPWSFEHWTPFNELGPEEAASPGYRRAIGRQHSVPDLPYGLDAWHDGAKVLSLLWADNGAFHVAAFHRGPWEAAALAL